MDLYEELLGLIDAFAQAGVDYAICGGIAVAFHGYARFTKDIDLLVQPENLDHVLDAVKSRNFLLAAGRIPFGVGGPNQREIYRISKIKGQEFLTLDLILVGAIFQEVWENRELFEWQGRQVQIVSAEGLAKMKLLAGRDQDLLDLKMLGLLSDDERENL